MAYTKTTWTNGTTKLNAANMNNIETGISELKDKTDGMKSELLAAVYPVGAIYMSVDSTNPGTLFGGTWTSWGAGKVPVGINTSDTDFDTVEKTGGNKTVTLTAAQCGVPAHSHGLNDHTHGLNNHVHGLNNHVHGLNSHTHTLNHSHWVRACGYGGSVVRHGVRYGTDYRAFACDYNKTEDLTYGVSSDAATGNTGAASGNTGGCSTNTAGCSTSTAAASGNTANNSAANASSAHTNMQPYIVCYMWKRTA